MLVMSRTFVTLGVSNLANLLVVTYVYREPDAIRLISAWKATGARGRTMRRAVAEKYR